MVERRRAVMPMFQAGTPVLVWLGGTRLEGRVDMASVKMRSLFITLANGEKLNVLGIPRRRDRAKKRVV